MAGRALSAKEVERITRPGTHWVAEGLYLQVREHTRSWLGRYKRGGRNHWVGLGSVRTVPLTAARDAAQRMRLAVKGGADPLAEKRATRAAARGTQVPTFAWCCTEYIAAHEAGWRNDKHHYQWKQTLTDYAGPVMGKLPVDEITVDHVLKVLKPIWTTKPETASRVRSRIELVLGWASAKSYRPKGDNPARWRGDLMHLLPPLSRVQNVTSHAAVPYSEVPELFGLLREAGTVGSVALMFTILTAARTGEVLGARWEEMNLKAVTWTVPAGRMKAGVEHVVPLTDEAIALLGTPKRSGLVFPSADPRQPLSNMTMLMCLRRIRDDKPTVHGFRSSFRTWAGDEGVAREVAEMCLAHAVGDAVEQAYNRSTYLERRRVVMDDWTSFCAGGGDGA